MIRIFCFSVTSAALVVFLGCGERKAEPDAGGAISSVDERRGRAASATGDEASNARDKNEDLVIDEISIEHEGGPFQLDSKHYIIKISKSGNIKFYGGFNVSKIGVFEGVVSDAVIENLERTLRKLRILNIKSEDIIADASHVNLTLVNNGERVEWFYSGHQPTNIELWCVAEILEGVASQVQQWKRLDEVNK